MRVGARSVIALTALAALSAIGTIQPVAGQSPITTQAAASGPPAGVVADRYDIGGRKLFMACVGPADSTLPTVIAEAGLGGDSSTFGGLVPLLAGAPFRSCAYDRAGMGNSDPPPEGAQAGPGPVTLEDGAKDLHALLAAAGVKPPYVLVAHSLGGWFARVFAADHPDEVAGIVFVDSSNPDQVARFGAVLPPARSGEDPRLTSFRNANDSFSTTPPSADIGWLDLGASALQAAATGDLGDRPVVVLTHGVDPLDLPEPYASREKDVWLELQDELASLSTRGVQRTVPGAGHFIQEDRPDAVAQAILDVQASLAAGPDCVARRDTDAVAVAGPRRLRGKGPTSSPDWSRGVRVPTVAPRRWGPSTRRQRGRIPQNVGPAPIDRSTGLWSWCCLRHSWTTGSSLVTSRW